MLSRFRQHIGVTNAIALALLMTIAGTPSAFANPHLLVDVKSGRVLEHEDAFAKWYPASLTKLMTAYTVFRQIDQGRISLQSPIVMSKKSAGQPASKLYLKPGDTLTLDDALKALLVKSANDIAYAIAENVGGTMPDFVNMMNREAARLGMTSTHFVNPNGLPGKGQYTTARDLGLLAVALKRDYPQYSSYFSLEGIQIGKKVYGNYNKLIGRFPGADGMKTGYICASGFNQVSSANRNGRAVVSVVLGSDNLLARADLSAALLEKGLSSRGSFTDPKIDNLKPYGNLNVVNDISDTICKKKGKVRSEGQDDEAEKVVSPYSLPIGRPLRVALITVSPASKGPIKNGEVAFDIPIPEPRPLN